MHYLTRTEKEHYAEEGYLQIRHALDQATIEELISEWQTLWEGINLEEAPTFVHWRDDTSGNRIADRLDPVQILSASFRSVCESSSVKQRAEELLGGPVVVLKDKLITKAPGTSGYSPHQDFPYWEGIGLEANDVLTAAIALDDVSYSHGPLELFAGRHLSRLSTDESGLDIDQRIADKLGEPYKATLTAGDVLYFHSLIPHQSAPNHAKTPRRMYLIAYARDCGNTLEMFQRYNDSLHRVHAVHRRNSPENNG